MYRSHRVIHECPFYALVAEVGNLAKSLPAQRILLPEVLKGTLERSTKPLKITTTTTTVQRTGQA